MMIQPIEAQLAALSWSKIALPYQNNEGTYQALIRPLAMLNITLSLTTKLTARPSRRFLVQYLALSLWFPSDRYQYPKVPSRQCSSVVFIRGLIINI